MNDLSPVLLIFVIIVGVWLLNAIKILREYERGVIFRLGRLLPEPKGPGLIFVFAPFDRMVRVSLRIDTQEVPPQDVVTRDNVTVKVNAVIFFRVIDPRLAVVGTELASGALPYYAALCGSTLARAHARSGDAARIAGYMGSGGAFDTAIADFAMAYAEQVEHDWRAFVEAIKAGAIEARDE